MCRLASLPTKGICHPYPYNDWLFVMKNDTKDHDFLRVGSFYENR
uniref:Uncharacterized protein n=1 Tax=Rhizophora mucronata TaxID=61149 RepID=A0A2P2QEP6_RHIMU